MADSPNSDEQTAIRSSKRSCRVSTLKLKPTIEKTEEEEEPVVTPEETDVEDPPEIYKPGDIVWHRVPGNPWWPALIYGSYYEEYIHTKVVKTPRRRKRRVYFVYFFGPDFEYTWTNTNPSVAYHGLDEFIRQAERTVENAVTKAEQESLANRYELKVSANKRAQWDQAIEQADEALKLSHAERIANFAAILDQILTPIETKRKNSSKKRNSSTTKRQSRKTSSSSTDKSSNRSSVKRQKTKSTPISTSTSLLRVGLPKLTVYDEKRIINRLLNHPNNENLTLDEAQSLACQLVTDNIRENSHIEMSCVQIEWFYDLLTNHPEIIFKYPHWFNKEIESSIKDSIYFKQCQLKNMLESHPPN